MAKFFLGSRWVGETLQRYRERPPLATLKGKRIVFSEREYTAALLHIYMGRGQNLSEIAELAHLSMGHLSFQRSQIDFMTLVDYLKTRFTAWYREILVIKEFSLTEYSDISEEFLLLDDIVQTQIRVPLWTQLRQTGLSLQSKIETELSIDAYDLTFFRRLFTFFILVDRLRPDVCHQMIKERLVPIAETLLEKDLEAIERQAEETYLTENIRDQLTQKLRAQIGAL
ncbi:MAG: hypothetical protein QME44_02850 [Thermodesulfobacteriota bacterium]|nr:hypothetical protein [Thermodesulfobacteriota bacterium]